MGDGDADIRAELFERSDLPPPAAEQAERHYRRLQALVERDAIAAADRSTWRKRLPIDGHGGPPRERYRSFEAWAEREGVDLAPSFGVRTRFSPARGGYTDWLVLPALCLAVYGGGDLAAVYPHADGGTTVTVADGLDRLERRRPPNPDGRAASAD